MQPGGVPMRAFVNQGRRGGGHMNIEIFPLEKVIVDGVSVYLGMDRSAVEAALGKGQPVRNLLL